jgi:glutaredoxin 3
LDVDFTREQLFELFPGARTFPQIKFDGQSIGGYVELKEHVAGRRTLLTEG